MIPFGEDNNIKIDVAHADLLRALVVAGKPKKVLELGIGGGQATDAILSGLEYNQQDYEYTLVDNWLDFGRKMPPEVQERYGSRVNLVTLDEREFVFACKEQYDLIMSDADHHNTDQWFEYVFEHLVAEGGILCYHDVTLVDQFPNLLTILNRCQEYNLNHKLFNKDSRPGEMCYRGFLVIFK